MNTKTLGMAAILAALCLMPAASANTPDDPWGPDVSVTIDVSNAQCEAASHEAGPVSVTEQDGPACTFTVAYDGNTVKARCGPDGVAFIVIYDDCDVDVFV